ncbi:MAG: hypothetical protein OXH32_11865 [Acidobacteria bacterium]|nr:hypothetical protein [Acidobacteriota bacterium]
MRYRIAFLSVLSLFFAGAAMATPTAGEAHDPGDVTLVTTWGLGPVGTSAQRLDEPQLAAYRGTGWVEAACAFGTGAGVPLAIGGLVASSLLLGIPGAALAIGGAVCMVVL